MLYEKLFFVFVVILCLMPNQSLAVDYLRPRYHNVENIAFATDGINCFIFRNYAEMRQNEIKRYINNEPNLFPTTKEGCQARCPRDCGIRKTIPVCAKYDGVYRFFSNECELWKIACLNGQFLTKVHERECYLQEYKSLKQNTLSIKPSN